MKFESLNINKDGNFYAIYSLPSPQKITKAVREQKKREVLIIGIPKKKIKEFLKTMFDDCDENNIETEVGE